MDYDETIGIESLVNATITPEAYNVLATTEYEAQELLKRHVNQDYGAIPFEAKFENDFAFHKQEGVATSRYPIDDEHVIIVTTRWNQPLTTISLEGE